MDLANFLLEQPSRWKVMGIDLMFFHQFFNEGLERELRTMRWQLYGREDPPMPLSPQEAANYFGRFMEPTPGRLSERATEREAFFRPIADSLVTLELRQLIRLAASGDQSKLDAIADELEAEIKQIAKDLAFTDAVIEQRMDAFGRTIEELLARNLVSDSAMVNVSLGPRLLILVVPIGQQDAFEKSEVFWRVADRLAELERRLGLLGGSLFAALVCGAPPVPESASFSMAFGDSEVCIRIYSPRVIGSFVELYKARLRELGVLKSRRVLHSRDAVEVAVSWISRGFLPHLRVTLDTAQGLPSPWRLERLLRHEIRGKVFHDRGTRGQDLAKRIRMWATVTLRLKCNMKGRPAAKFWNDRCPPSLRFRHRDENSQDAQLNQERQRVRRRIVALQESVPL
jgi:hypothetical protein